MSFTIDISCGILLWYISIEKQDYNKTYEEARYGFIYSDHHCQRGQQADSAQEYQGILRETDH